MSKIVNKYNELKENNKEKLYLFESGIFYVFIHEDADIISDKLGLKITHQGDYYKCGFPIKSKDKYFKLLEENNIDYEIIILEKKENEPKKEKIVTESKISIKDNNFVEKEVIRKLKSINVEYYTPIEALNFLKELKEIIK